LLKVRFGQFSNRAQIGASAGRGDYKISEWLFRPTATGRHADATEPAQKPDRRAAALIGHVRAQKCQESRGVQLGQKTRGKPALTLEVFVPARGLHRRRAPWSSVVVGPQAHRSARIQKRGLSKQKSTRHLASQDVFLVPLISSWTKACALAVISLTSREK